jgi:signal transduction histidine kinase
MGALGLAAAAVAAAGTMIWSTESTEDALDRELVQDVRALAASARRSDPATFSAEIQRRLVATGADHDLYLYAESTRTVITGSWSTWPSHLPSDGEAHTFAVGGPEAGRAERYVRMLAASLPDGRNVAVGRDVTERERLRRRLGWTAAGSLGVALLLAVGGGLLVSRRLLGRIEAMSDTIVDILRSGRRMRVPMSAPPDEFDALAGHFNQLLDENEALVERTREVTNEIAHDLRTPLSHMRTHIDAALAGASAGTEGERVLLALRGDVDRILETFNALLHIAQVESGRARDEMRVFDLTQLASDVCELYEPAAEDAGLTLDARLEAGVATIGHSHLLAQALTNLLENALKYAGRGVVTVSLATRGDEVVLAVADQGPGVPAADRTRVLQRFARLESSRSQPGAGLGLAFVAAVARFHEAALELEDAGPGLRVALVLARAPE